MGERKSLFYALSLVLFDRTKALATVLTVHVKAAGRVVIVAVAKVVPVDFAQGLGKPAAVATTAT